MKVSPYISKTVLGRCIKSNRELRFYSGFDYIIEVSGNVWDKLDDEQKYILVFHELLHIDITSKKNGEPALNIRDHTIQLTNLEPDTIYYYVVNSTDIAANSAESTEYSFQTLADTIAPVWSNKITSPTSPQIYDLTKEYNFNVSSLLELLSILLLMKSVGELLLETSKN